MQIRKATVKDVPKLVKMYNLGIKTNYIYNGSNKPKTKEQIKKSLNLKDKCFFVAEENNQLFGMINYSFKKSGRTRHRIDFGWFVHPEHQNKGIGTKLLQFALNHAKKKGFKKAEAEAAIENIPSWKIATKLGFKIEGKKKKGLLLDNGKFVDTYILGKEL